VIKNCTNLKWVQILSAGIDKLPFEIIGDEKIIITNARGIHYIPMSEYTIAVLLQIARKSNDIYLNQLNKKWDRTIRLSEINGATLGIVGLGSIGQGIAQAAKAFDMKVIGLNRDGREVEHVDKVYKQSQLKDLLAESDYVVVIVPLTDGTYHLIGEEELKAMKKTAYIINIARGDVIDEKALIDVLKNKEIAGAVLDVFTQEPLPSESPLWTLENCIITPHMSGRSPKYMQRVLEIFKFNMDLYLEGKITAMKNLIDIKRKY